MLPEITVNICLRDYFQKKKFREKSDSGTHKGSRCACEGRAAMGHVFFLKGLSVTKHQRRANHGNVYGTVTLRPKHAFPNKTRKECVLFSNLRLDPKKGLRRQHIYKCLSE